MQWLLDNSGWIIAAAGVLHAAAFGVLWVNRNRQTRRLEGHLRNIVGTLSVHTDVDPANTIDENIDSFLHDIREVLRDPARRDDQRKLHQRLVLKEESKKYLQGKSFETWYNVLQTFIETYPFWGILGTLLGIGLGIRAASAGANTTEAIVRNFGGAIWSTVAGLVCAIVLMLLNAAMEPALRRLVEHRAAVRDVIRAAKTELAAALGTAGGGAGASGAGARPGAAGAAA